MGPNNFKTFKPLDILIYTISEKARTLNHSTIDQMDVPKWHSLNMNGSRFGTEESWRQSTCDPRTVTLPFFNFFVFVGTSRIRKQNEHSSQLTV